MKQIDGLTEAGLQTALGIKKKYQIGEPICVPGEDSRILMPENLINHHLDLQVIDDPLVLAMMATRDPEAPMALAAASRFGPLGAKTELLKGVYGVVGEASRHPLVKKCVSLISENAFNPKAIASIRRHASKFIVHTRKEYTHALRNNLRALLDGDIAPRLFVREFFELTEAGNMRSDIRMKLVSSLLLSESIRPSIKFLFLENLEKFPDPVRRSIVQAVLEAPPSHHMELLKEELRWIAAQDKAREETSERMNQVKAPVRQMVWN